ncbi:hypothetical protein KUTeg_002471 [Tegillarca granosa]|uniref:Galactose mutarotase n=1 Tax=Tegillarca granosa TaxID=220873 RepID=A0ABQ9FUD7_TEGGR|nr:hypothetical protein KUTeg_002471 [Tegillarca granosa]
MYNVLKTRRKQFDGEDMANLKMGCWYLGLIVNESKATTNYKDKGRISKSCQSQALYGGQIANVEGTLFDLRTPVKLGDRLKEVNNGMGFDNNFCVGEENKMKTNCKVTEHSSNFLTESESTHPQVEQWKYVPQNQGVQFYTSYFLKDTRGKSESVYGQFSAFCLECQHYPDSIHHLKIKSKASREEK